MRMMALALMLAATPAVAGEWEFIVNPYFMAPSSNGKFGVGPFDTSINQSPADVFRNLNWGVMGALEANNGNWGFNIDVNYMNLNITDPDIRRFRTTGHQAAYTATVLKRIHPNAWVYAGARLSDMGVRLQCDNNCAILSPPRNIDVSRNHSWVEYLAGFRAVLPFNERFDLTFNADLGGLGVGSEVSVNAWPQLGWRISEGAKAMLGYRIIYVKHESEEDGKRFVYDAATFGPTLGVEFKF